MHVRRINLEANTESVIISFKNSSEGDFISNALRGNSNGQYVELLEECVYACVLV